MTYSKNIFLSTVVLVCIVFFTTYSFSHAQSVDELKSKIGARNEAIAKLEQEIKQYQEDITALGEEKDSLSNTIKSLDISKKQLEANTKVLENKIYAKNLEIEQLSLQIGDKSDRIVDSKKVISKSLFTIYEMNSASIIESILGKSSFSDLWKTQDELAVLQGSMQDKIKDLNSLKSNLEDNKKLTEIKKSELVGFTNDLKNQSKIIAETVKEKNSILAQTKNTETNYNKLLLAKKNQRDAFEKEIAALENSLKVIIDASSIPSTGSGVLKWPLDKVRITQYFGNTEFATKNPQIYISGKGHNGVDFAASIGTSVKAALDGTVVGSGNMRSCAYGKWVMIKHGNGLSTLYAHLSLITVTQGQTLATGDVLGYSGNTGITTGPHLHFGVYATQGVNIKNISSSCGTILYPLGVGVNGSAYLNPLSYL